MKKVIKKLSLAVPGKDDSPHLNKTTSSAHDLSSLYTEHFWNLQQIVQQNKDSNINEEQPEKSQGLSFVRAKQLLEANGPNKLPAPKEISDLKLFLSQFFNILWILLTVASTLSLIGYIFNPSDITSLLVSIILYVMIVVMCFVTFYQEREARKVVRGFENLLPSNCVVIRESQETTISAEDLVVGDIIRIKSGTKVPADARILYCVELKLETSSITGESEPIEYQSAPVNNGVNIFEARNVAFNGSMCTDGEGVCLVIKTAKNTIIGQIATMTTSQAGKKSRLEIQIGQFVKFVAILACAVGVLSFVVGGFVQHWSNIIVLLVTSFTVCSVAMIPEGLPATVTSILTLVARRLAAKNVYLKRLDIVEALGSANIIASDKTGTLTKNEMTVTDVWYSNEYVTEIPDYKLGGNQRTLTVKTISKVDGPLSDLLMAMTICNSACFDESGQNERKKKKMPKIHIEMPPIEEKPIESNEKTIKNRFKSISPALTPSHTLTQNTIQQIQRRQRRMELIQGMRAIGAPSEVALIKYAEQLINVHQFRRRFNVVFEIPFNSKRKFHLVISKVHEMGATKNQYLMQIKGAPEIIIKRCAYILTADGDLELTKGRFDEFQKAYDIYGKNGRRVIGFAHKYFAEDTNVKFSIDNESFFENLVFLGVCAIMDPPRDETKTAITHCKEAGIKVFMVTGDHHITATAIACQIGLIGTFQENGEPNWEVVKGEDISKLTALDWDRLVAKQNLVFARTTPEQKYRIVEECQKRNQIITMTGDGVNDAPALKKSDIGVGMGSGSDVAKQAADIVLVDDNFSSMVKAVEEGRLIFDNIKKMIVYVLTHTLSELSALFVHYFFGMPFGTTTLMILSIDLGTEILPGIAICKELMEGDIMRRPPRKQNESLISKALIGYVYGYTGFLQALGCFLAYCSVFWSYNINISDLWMSHTDWQSDKILSNFSNGVDLTPEMRNKIGQQACSAWQIGIVFGQVFHIFSVRTLRESLFTHGLFSNMAMNCAIVADIIILLIYVYVPGINTVLGGAPVNGYPWAIVACFGTFIFAYNELRKYVIRNYPNNLLVQLFKF